MIDDKNTVSILISNYNYEKYIEDCIKSVLSQSIIVNQLIIVDDCSSDNSVNIIKDLTDSITSIDLVQFFTEQKNIGQNALLNKYTNEIKSDYMIILDSDDVLDKNYIESCLIELKNFNKNLYKPVYCHTYLNLINSNNEVFSKSKLFSGNEKPEYKNILPRTALIESSVIKSILPLDENIKINTKYLLWEKISNKNYIGTIFREYLFNYRIHEKNTSTINKILRRRNSDIHIQNLWKSLIDKDAI